jgi:ferredoxin-NADP reductase
MPTSTVALIIAGAIVAQVIVLALVGVLRARRRARSAEPSSDQLAQGSAPTAARPGYPSRDFREMVVARKVLEDQEASVCSFYLVPADGQPLAPFRPGQYLTFSLPITAAVERAPRPVVRCYSLSERPRPDYYRITVKRVLPPAGRPDLPAGLSSSYFHEQVHEGSRLRISAPAGHFHLHRDDALPVVLIAGGIGLTPLLSMLNSMLDTATPGQVWLFYGVRSGAEHLMKEHLLALAKAHPSFHLHVCYSRPGPGDVEGVDYQHPGRIGIQTLRQALSTTHCAFFVCGPRAMLENLVPALREWGVAEHDIHYESFGPASLATHETAGPAREDGAGMPVNISFSLSGRRIPWNPAAGSLLAFAEENGIEVESGCRAGSCGCCETALEAGEVEYDQQPDADLRPGHCLLCIGRPASDLTLAA